MVTGSVIDAILFQNGNRKKNECVTRHDKRSFGLSIAGIENTEEQKKMTWGGKGRKRTVEPLETSLTSSSRPKREYRSCKRKASRKNIKGPDLDGASEGERTLVVTTASATRGGSQPTNTKLLMLALDAQMQAPFIAVADKWISSLPSFERVKSVPRYANRNCSAPVCSARST